MALSNLTISIRATANEWSKDLKAIQRDAKALEGAMKPFKQSFADFGKPLLAAGLAVSASLVGLAKVAADYGDSLDQAAEKTGVSVENLSKLKYAADQSNSSFEDVSTGLKFLAKNMFAAGTGAKEQSQVFSALGVSVKDSAGALRPMNDVLLDVSDRFKTLPDGPEKAALSMKLFGKQGEALIPLLNRGSDGIKELGDQAQRSGLVMDAASAKMGDGFNKSVDRAKAAALGFSVTVANSLLPSLTSMADKATSGIIYIRGLANEFPGASKAAAVFGASLVGAGGLLVGLSGLAIVIPSVVKGVLLLQGVIAPATILLAVRSYADLAAGITLVGQASVVATAGMVGLAAALGVGIGMAINAGIAYLGLTKDLDQSLNTSLRNVSKGWLGWITDQKEAINTSASLQAATQKLSDGLAAQGIIVARGSDDLNSWNKRVVEAAHGTEIYKKSLADAAKNTGDTGKATTDLDANLKNLLADMEKAEKVKDPFADLRKNFHDLLNPAAELEANILALSSRFGASSQDIIKAYGGQIIDVAEKTLALGDSLTPLMAALYADAKAFEAVHASAKKVSEIMEQLKGQKLPETMIDFSGSLLTVDKAAEDALDSIVALRGAYDSTAARVKALRDAHASTAEIIEIMGDDLLKEADAAMRLGVALPPATQELATLARAAKNVNKEAAEGPKKAKDFSDAWANSIANLNTRIAESLADMVVNFKFQWKSLIDVAKETAKGMLSAFISGLISPLTNSLAKLGQKAAGAISGAVFGGGGAAAGGVAGTVGAGGAAAAGGGVAAGGGISGAAVAGFATNPVTVAVAGAIATALVIKNFVGAGRKAADAYTTGKDGNVGLQAQFNQRLGFLVDSFERARMAGTLTLEGAKQTKDALSTLWQAFLDASAQFASQGKNQAKVVSQGMADYTKNFGSNLGSIFSGMESTISTLTAKEAADAAAAAAAVSGSVVAGGVAGIPQTGRAISASTIFADAVDVFKDIGDKIAAAMSGVTAGGGGGAPLVLNISSAPQITINGDPMDLAFRVRDEIAPALLRELDLDMNGITKGVIRILKARWNGDVITGGSVA